MANEIFDRETQLDLLVNIIPLFILAFFIVGFLLFAPFGLDPLASSIQLGLIAVPFVLLAVLTYFAAVAVAGSEKSGPVYLPGQASVSGAEPLEVPEQGDTDAVPDDSDAAPAELGGDAADSEESAAGDTAEPAVADPDEADPDEAEADAGTGDGVAEDDADDADNADQST